MNVFVHVRIRRLQDLSDDVWYRTERERGRLRPPRDRDGPLPARLGEKNGRAIYGGRRTAEKHRRRRHCPHDELGYRQIYQH